MGARKTDVMERKIYRFLNATCSNQILAQLVWLLKDDRDSLAEFAAVSQHSTCLFVGEIQVYFGKRKQTGRTLV